MKNTYKIKYNWKHVQGHIATSNWTGKVFANSEREAIIKYKEKTKLTVGQYINEDVENNYFFYGEKRLLTSKEDNIVYAVCVNES